MSRNKIYCKVFRMEQRRKTTFEERIEIAQYTIRNRDLDYQKSMENMMFLIHRCTHGFVNINLAVRKPSRTIARWGLRKSWMIMNDSSWIVKLEARNESQKWRTLWQKSWQRSGDDIHANVSPTCRLVSSKNCTLRKRCATKLCKLAGVARFAHYKWLKWKPNHQGI
ncbi:hypothetical protein P7H19_14195 [Paenibacillus larvae]|nr:hypothetical protein [Paenibacillus larvae]MDT2237207.1 hypothetical protein [Paenibacillus larvae]